MRSALAISLLVVTSLIAGCAGPGQGVIYNRHVDGAYRPQEFWMNTGGRDLLTEIYGNPFTVDHDALAAAVTTAMHGAHFGPETNFTATPGDNDSHPYRVRLLFNALPTSGMSLCADTPIDVPAAPVASTTGRGVDVKLLAAYCASGGRITSLTAGVDGISGPDDPAFTAFIRQVTRALFPPNNPDNNSNRCNVPGC
jgi:hypothetical protein